MNDEKALFFELWAAARYLQLVVVVLNYFGLLMMDRAFNGAQNIFEDA